MQFEVAMRDLLAKAVGAFIDLVVARNATIRRH